MDMILEKLGAQFRRVRHLAGLSQSALAQRLGRDRARISEFERDLATGRMGRDRLTLFAEICDAFDLVPLLVPRGRASEISALLEGSSGELPRGHSHTSAFDELFVDLGDEEELG